MIERKDGRRRDKGRHYSPLLEAPHIPLLWDVEEVIWMRIGLYSDMRLSADNTSVYMSISYLFHSVIFNVSWKAFVTEFSFFVFKTIAETHSDNLLSLTVHYFTTWYKLLVGFRQWYDIVISVAVSAVTWEDNHGRGDDNLKIEGKNVENFWPDRPIIIISYKLYNNCINHLPQVGSFHTCNFVTIF